MRMMASAQRSVVRNAMANTRRRRVGARAISGGANAEPARQGGRVADRGGLCGMLEKRDPARQLPRRCECECEGNPQRYTRLQLPRSPASTVVVPESRK
jgi:hypothetical protein